MKLNRETDIMLIVLSFSILLSQLPFTIAWYLIYYQMIMKKSQYDQEELFFYSSTPIFLYIIRLIEMVYFSLNFLFYITLSPSLRREIKTYTFKVILSHLLFIKQPNTPQSPTNHGVIINNFNNKSKKEHNPSDKKDDSLTPLPSPINNHLKHNNDGTKKRLYSNSSGEFMEYLDKLRSISPLRRPNFLIKSPYADPNALAVPVPQVETPASRAKFDDETNNVKKKKKSGKFRKYFKTKKLLQNSNPALDGISVEKVKKNIVPNNYMANDKNSKIKIVIDNLYDEEEELKIDDDIILDKLEETITNENYSLNEQHTAASTPNRFDSLPDGNKRQVIFNWASSSFLTTLDDGKLCSDNKILSNSQRLSSAENSDHQIAYL
jgi:hypothetical protein